MGVPIWRINRTKPKTPDLAISDENCAVSRSAEFYFTTGIASTRAAPLRAVAEARARIETFDERNHDLGFD